MKPIIIYYSHTGNTRSVAEAVLKACDGELVEVTLAGGHTVPVAYFLGLFRSMSGKYDPIHPESIDVSTADVVVIGTPVWGRRATPAVRSAVQSLVGCEGKRVVLFATCGAVAGDTLPILGRDLEARGLTVAGQVVFTEQDIANREKLDNLVELVRETGNTP